MATTESFAERSIVIIGRKGAGKSTIANNLSQTNKFPVGCILSKKESWIWKDTATSPDGLTSLAFYMIESIPLDLGLKPTAASNSCPPENVSFPESVSLVIFAFKYGCFTGEEKDFFERIMRSFNDNLKSISALVITGCDDLSEDAKRAYTQDFKEDAETKEIASFMQKGIYCVSLPDITKIRAEFVQVYQKDIEQSEKTLKSLLDSSSQICSLESLLKENPDVSGSEPDALLKLVAFCKTNFGSRCKIL